ncbi:hypothetical protein QQF64_012045 [Cirrhinus molitorella]|uniref:ribonuclease H n=1 Tax=Cirrhinus molitorella TaxID=172907 RepID=A0ABR3LVH4_9TELE
MNQDHQLHQLIFLWLLLHNAPKLGHKRKRSNDLIDFLKLEAEKEDSGEQAAVQRRNVTTESEAATATLPELVDVNPHLWAEHKDDAGLINVHPYVANLIKSTPVYYPVTQPLFAFTFDHTQFQWTRLPQGMIESSSVFASIVHKMLMDAQLPPDTCLLQYADDILITGVSADLCAAASAIVCNILAEAGFKASRDKLQWVQRRVNYLGHELSEGTIRLSADRIKAIATYKRPSMKKLMLSFLGLVNYCRAWVPNCSMYDRILRAAISQNSDDITWTAEMDLAFRHLKASLTRPPALGLPTYTTDFHLYVHEGEGTAAAILAQEHGGIFRPVAYLSKTLDSVARGLPACLRAVAATAIMVQDAERIFLSHPLIVHTSHQGEFEETDHDCLARIHTSTACRPDVSASVLEEGKHWYVDGSCYKPNDNEYWCGYSIVELPDRVIEAYSLPYKSAQVAELIALTRACQLAKEQCINIYTDSKYAHGVVHDFAKLWEERDFKTSEGKPISHHSVVAELIHAAQLPSKLAVIKVTGHASGESEEAKGNRLADEVAKWAAKDVILSPYVDKAGTEAPMMSFMLTNDLDIKILQANPTQSDLNHWAANEVKPDQAVDRFSKWPEAFPCGRENAQTVVKVLAKEIIPRFGIPTVIESDNGTPFASKVTQLLAKELDINWHFGILFHPQSQSLAERFNGIIKDRITKACMETGRNWVDVLPAVLAEIRMSPSSTTKMSPFEILMGRPFPTPWVEGCAGNLSTGDTEVIIADYVDSLIKTLNDINGDVSLSLPLPAEKPTHPFVPGQQVLIKCLKPPKLGEPKYFGPATVIAVTRTGVLTDFQPRWIHASRLKAAPETGGNLRIISTAGSSSRS